MTVNEARFLEMVPHLLKEIATQLKTMNKLKALELKGHQDLNLSPEMVDEVVEA